MGFTALERLFVPERYRQRAANTGFSIPALQEVQVQGDAGPMLASNMRRKFVQVQASSSGTARYGFSECAIEAEGDLLCEFYQSLKGISVREGWSNRCRGVDQALKRLPERGVTPKSVVVSGRLLADILEDDCDLEMAQRRMDMQGFVAMVDGMQILLGDLPDGAALVAADPQHVGCYTRVADHLGLLAQRVDRAIMVVGDDLA